VSKTSISPTAEFRQDRTHTKQLVDAYYIRPVAEALYRFDRRDDQARLDALDPESQQKYVADAMVVAYMRDATKVMPALYYAAEGVTRGGVGSCSRLLRVHIVAILELVFARLRKALSDQAPLVEMATFKKLIEADTEEAKREADAREFAEVNPKPSGAGSPWRLM
jgi:hypothetical protein